MTANQQGASNQGGEGELCNAGPAALQLPIPVDLELCNPHKDAERESVSNTNAPLIFGDGLCATCIDGHPGSPANVAHSSETVEAVCSFDIDQTLKAQQHPSVASKFKENAKYAVESCRRNGLGIAINTAQYWCAQHNNGSLQGLSTNLQYLREVGFDDAVLRSRAVQFASIRKLCSFCDPREKEHAQCLRPLKRQALDAIRDFYNIRPQCVVHFDDRGGLEEAIRAGGYSFVHVGKRGFQFGISRANVQEGLDSLVSNSCTKLTQT